MNTRRAAVVQRVQMMGEKDPGETSPLGRTRDREAQDFRLVRSTTRHDETCGFRGTAEEEPVYPNRLIGQERLEISGRPGPRESARVDGREPGSMLVPERQDAWIEAACPEQVEPAQSRGKRAESCGFAPGPAR